MRVLNLYAGIGGNRKLWQDVEVTAVEYNEEIAAIYKEYFPGDTVVVGDAHQYLLDHYKEFDFIWSSRPCITHTRARFWASKGGRYDVAFPDFGLYEEIVFLEHFFKGKYVVENVQPYYEPLVKPTIKIGRHLFWTNFKVDAVDIATKEVKTHSVTASTENYGFTVKDRNIKHRKDQIIRNLVNPEIGLYIMEQARGIIRQVETPQLTLFKQAI